MKLIRFTTADSPNPLFGVVIQNQAVSFAVLQSKVGKSFLHLADSRSYLVNLPDSEQEAREAVAWGEQHLGELVEGERFPLNAVRLLEPVEVAALFDFGLTPRHLKNSGETIGKYEKDNPQTAPLLQAFAKAVMAPKAKPTAGQPEALSYYKSNMNTIVGDGETVPWPAYTSRLDVESELAVVYGNVRQPVAGFFIFNDVSARDVQATEFVGGFCLTKDMAKGNQLGPYLVTPDEVGDPYNLKVTVVVNGKVKYQGSTSEISHKAEDGRTRADPLRANVAKSVHLVARLRGTYGFRPGSHPHHGLRVQACGDCHLLNFGLFATPERNLIFDLNDFDETLPAPWEWAVKRLAVSFAVAARDIHISDKKAQAAAIECVRAYREQLREFSKMSPLDVWYYRLDSQTIIDTAPDARIREKRKGVIAKAKRRIGDYLYPQISEEVGDADA